MDLGSLGPVGTLPLSEQIHRRLLDGILEGTIGETLPAERELAATFGVNRHAVREALKRLQQAGLIEVQQGGATRVLPLREHAQVDLLPHLLLRGGEVDGDLVAAVLEFRACVGADAARLCALRSPGTAGALRALLPTPDMPEPDLELTNLALWTAIVDGSGNLAYRLALNTLVAGIDRIRTSEVGRDVMRDLHAEYRRAEETTALVEAIAAGDGPAAERLAWVLLRR